MVNIFDVPPNTLIREVAEELKKIKEINPPEWSAFVKTGVHKERVPDETDWWYIRAAAVLRSLHKLGPIGVSKLRRKYGGRKRRGHKPEEFRKGSGNIIRKILQQLEEAKLVLKSNNPSRKGRVISPQGMSLLAKTAKKHIPQEVLKRSAQKKEDKPAQPDEKSAEEQIVKAAKEIKEKEDTGKDQSKSKPAKETKTEEKSKPAVEAEEKVETKKEEKTEEEAVSTEDNKKE